MDGVWRERDHHGCIVFDPYEYCADQCNESCLSVLLGKKFKVGHYTQTFQPIFSSYMLC